MHKFYFITVEDAIKKLDLVFLGKHQMELIAWEPDFLNDQVTYKIKYK